MYHVAPTNPNCGNERRFVLMIRLLVLLAKLFSLAFFGGIIPSSVSFEHSFFILFLVFVLVFFVTQSTHSRLNRSICNVPANARLPRKIITKTLRTSFFLG